MKKVTYHAVAVAVGALFAGSAFAGSISAPATPTQFAVEALSASPVTAVTTPTIQYTMGVGRPAGNGFTIIMTPSAGSTLGPCIVPTYSVPAQVNATLKRQSATECAVDVQVVAPGTLVGGIWTWTSQTFLTHPLANKGNSIAVSINLKDPGETAQVDNSGALTKTIAQSVQSINIYAVTSDTNTVADVNAVGGPLTGFVANVAPPADTATTAEAALAFDHNSILAVAADGTTLYAFAGTVSLTLTGTTNGVATNGFCIDLNNNAVLCEVPERFTVTSSAASLANVVSGFGAAGSLVSRNVSFTANGTTQLGTSRNFAVTGTVTPTLAGTVPNALVDNNGKNATAWVWSANASQLVTPYFSTNPQYVTRFSILNTGGLPVGYTTRCFTEDVGTSVAGVAGTLKADGTTVIDATGVCTFSGAPRGAILFTINAPISSIKGAYNIVDKVSGANGFVPMTRPYNTNTTE